MSLFLLVLLVALMIPLVAVVLDSQVGRALAGRLEARPADSLAERRLATLENEVDRLNREVQRLDDESTFLHKLLEQKRAPEALPPGERTD
jgi:cell division protein FtsB